MTTTADPSLSAPARKPGTWSQLRPLVLRLHFLAGIFVAPFLFVAALTGLAYVFTPQFNELIYPTELFASDAAAAARSLDEQVAAAVAATPGGTLASLVVPSDPARTTSVVFDVPGLAEDVQRTVYVDPSTATVRGSLDTWFGYTPVQTTFDNLHRHMLLGEPGRLYSEMAASWLPVLVIGGLALWFGRRRTRRKAAALLLPPIAAKPGRGRIRGWHATTALWMTVGLLFISATGLTWSTYAGDRFQQVITSLEGRTPKLAAEPVAVNGTVIGVEQAVAAARAAGLRDRLAVTPPSEPGAVFTVGEDADTWPVKRDKVSIDPYSGAITETIRWDDFPALAKLTTIGILMHMGLLFGLVNQLGLAALALGLLCVLFWGYRMAWLRRPRFTAPTSRGTFRGLSQPVGFAVVLVTVAAGWLMPAFGVSLLAFLVLDTAWSLRPSRA